MIQNDEEHRQALEEIDRLWDSAQPGTPDGETFDKLVDDVVTYEKERFPIPLPEGNDGG